MNIVKSKRRVLDAWYPEYWAQTWYRNTFLVRRPEQIARAIDGCRDWNSVYDSGCNFACLSMIIGLDPARLASLLSSASYFRPDSELPAHHLTGKTSGLVWDQNAPHEDMRSIAIKNVWLPRLQRRCAISVHFIARYATSSHLEGARLVGAMHRRGRHVICGPEEHSHLVAGEVDGSFYVWDPDDTERSVEMNIGGAFTLPDLFTAYKRQPIEFWEYDLKVT